VELRHERIRWAGRDRACGQAPSVFTTLHGPDAREAKGSSRLESNEERRPATSVVLSPLVEAVRYDETAMTSKGVSKHRRGG